MVVVGEDSGGSVSMARTLKQVAGSHGTVGKGHRMGGRLLAGKSCALAGMQSTQPCTDPTHTVVERIDEALTSIRVACPHTMHNRISKATSSARRPGE